MAVKILGRAASGIRFLLGLHATVVVAARGRGTRRLCVTSAQLWGSFSIGGSTGGFEASSSRATLKVFIV